MEIVRSDYLSYVREVRRTLRGLADGSSNAKMRDDIACADRILCLVEAEYDFLASSEAEITAHLDAIVSLVTPLLHLPALTTLMTGLEKIDETDWPSQLPRIAALRQLFQAEMPALGVVADAGHSAAADALDALLRNETAQFDAVHDRRRAFEIVAPADAPGIETPASIPMHQIAGETLRDYLRASFDEPALEIADIQNVPGGRSKETTLIALDRAPSLPDRIVMRADIPGGLVPSKATDEYAIIAIADRYGVPVPTPLRREIDPARLGRTFILVAAAAGATEGEYFTDLHARVTNKLAVGEQLAGILAKIHSIPLAELQGTHLDATADLGDLVRTTIETTYEQARSFDFPARTHLEMAYRWLKKNLHLAEDTPCLIHCDVGLHNMLIDQGRITAMLDWELATIASPAREVSKIFHLIDYLMPREAFFHAYRAAGGPANALDPDRMNFYAVMNYMVTNQRARFANRLFFSGQRRDIVMANAGYDSFYRGTTLLSNVLRPIYPAAYAGIASHQDRQERA